MPESLHAELAKASQREGVSLNGYITDVLTRAVGGSAPSRAAREPSPAPARRPLLERLLLVNLVVVAAVGALVVVLIVQSLR
jgi:HicB-like protein involved in pilus formation